MLLDLSISELASGIRQKRFSPADLVRECYERIDLLDKSINAFITVVDKKTALARAYELEKNIEDNASQLHGIPFVLKDGYVTQGIRTTAASNMLGNYIPQYDATVYRKLLAAGAILIGKMNMDAWGHGGSSENTDFGAVRNPWNTDRVAGGSSGGPAAAVAARMATFAIAEDTGGSIRNPSAWCGVTGLKVTYGRVSRYGTIAYASSFDTVGPMAKSVAECAVIMENIAGRDPFDATSSPEKVPQYTRELGKPVKGIRIGILKESFSEGLDEQIHRSIIETSEVLKSLGCDIRHVSMPIFEYGIPDYYLIAPSETSSNLARYDGVRYGEDRSHFTPETMRRIMIGTFSLSSGYYDAYYKRAQKVRTMFRTAYKDVFASCDAILMPVNPSSPTKIGELISNPLQNMLSDLYTITQNIVGVPSLAIPCGFTHDGLPIGAQLVGTMFSESLLLRLGHAYQRLTKWHTLKPPKGTN